MEQNIEDIINMQALPEHVAIIMDGNRRWAKKNNLSTPQGHKEGAENLKRIAKFANKIGIKHLTVYAFSTENWKRSQEEVGAIMKLLKFYLLDFFNWSDENIKINVLGRIAELPKDLKDQIHKIEEKTKNNTGLVLNICFNYGGRDEIVKAMKKIATEYKEGKIELEQINEEAISKELYTKDEPDPDLVIRTSGEMRLSNFLPWQSVYSELLFVEKNWPDFTEEDLDNAIIEYQKRTRKFGAN